MRLHIDDIESFSKVKDVNQDAVADLLHDGYLDVPEDTVQRAIEEILSVPSHKDDWGGETNDLYTANVFLKETRVGTAFLLKGRGLKNKELKIRDCGKNGDQLLRLLQSPAEFFVVQFVGRVSEAVIKDVEGKVRQARAEGKPASFCVIDGQDTARLLRAYGKL